MIQPLVENRDRDIFLALDNDLPSEYISWLISSYLLDVNKHQGAIKRLDIVGYSHSEIQKALDRNLVSHPESAREFYVRFLFNGSLARHLQRLVGFSNGPGGMPLNYMTLTTIFLLVDREVEIKMFSAMKKWQIMVTFGFGETKFKANLVSAPGVSPDGVVKDPAIGKKFIDGLAGKQFIVNEIERAELRISPPSPYTIAELCHEALVLHGIGPALVLHSLKRLYCGVLLDGTMTGLISSYTFTENDLTSWRENIRKYVATRFGDQEVQDDTGPLASNLLLPAVPSIAPEDVEGSLDKESLAIYGMIRGRAMASQMKEAVGSTIKARIVENDNVFHGHFNSIIEKGFLQIHQGMNSDELMSPSPFANLQEGQALDFLGAHPEQVTGVATEHYTCETLFADLAEFSVPVNPTSMKMLQGLMNHDCLKIASDGYLVCGVNGNNIARYLNKAFPKMIGVNLSAYIEQTVTEVISGRKGLDFALKQFEQTLTIQGKVLVKAKISQQIVTRRKSSSSRIIKHVSPPKPQPVEEVAKGENIALAQDDREDKVAPPALAGTQAVEGQEKGASLSEPKEGAEQEEGAGVIDQGTTECLDSERSAPTEMNIEDNGESMFSDPAGIDNSGVDAESLGDLESPDPSKIKMDVTPESEIMSAASSSSSASMVTTDKQKDCQMCGRPMILKKDQFGKFWDCSGFPACRHSESYCSHAEAEMSCPLCLAGKVLTKRTPTGKTFYVCLESACEFMAWSKPHTLSCQVCESPYLVEKKSPQGHLHLRCPRAGCNYMCPMPGEGGLELLQEQQAADLVSKSSTTQKTSQVRKVQGKGGSAAVGGKKKVRVVRRRK